MEWIKIKAQVFLISFSIEERFKKTNISFCSPQCQPRFLLLLSQRTKLTTDKLKFVAKKLLLFRFWLEDFQKKGWRPSLYVLFVVAFQRKGWIEFVLRMNNSSIFNINGSNNLNTINGSSNNNHNSRRGDNSPWFSPPWNFLKRKNFSVALQHLTTSCLCCKTSVGVIQPLSRNLLTFWL